MKVKDFINETKPRLKSNDLILIYGFEILPNGDKINHYIESQDLIKWPKLNDLEILKTNKDKINFSNVNLNGQETNNGQALEYSAIVDYNEIRKAKGLKPLNNIMAESKQTPKRTKKKRFTL